MQKGLIRTKGMYVIVPGMNVDKIRIVSIYSKLQPKPYVGSTLIS